MAAVYTVRTSLIQIFNCLSFPNFTLETYQKWRADTFSASQIDCTPLDSQMRAGKQQTSASRVIFNRQLVSRAAWAVTGDLWLCVTHCGGCRVILSEAVDGCICFTRKIQHGGD